MPEIDPRTAMNLAIEQALRAIENGQAPFGCVLVKDGRVIARAHNTVWQDTDPTAHAEINALRTACQQLRTIDLSGAELYTTCEPCPMCYTAAHWARISRVIFGARIEDARNAGFNELPVPSETLNRYNPAPPELVPGFMAEECRRLFELWKQLGAGRPY
ncbi:MAG: nucleoside deaminase [candidate division WOR-3 bacterium]